MKDEIKEILDEIKILNGNVTLGYEKSQLLLDYITNLQTIEQQYSAILSENAELENKIINLEEENKRLRELDENYPIEEQLEEALKYENIYKQRNEKAIEELEKIMPICIMPNNMLIHGNRYAEAVEKTLNLLQGEDND